MAQATSRGGGRRSRGQQPRDIVVKVKLSAAELATVADAADRVGKATAAYLAQAGLDAAECRAVTVPVFQQQLLAELLRAAGQVRRAGVNLNQAVAKLNATGQPGPDLEPAAAYCARVARRVDEAAELVRRRMS